MYLQILIDGVDRTSKLIETQPFIVSHQVENGVNNPVCSTAKFTLHNDFAFENFFTDSIAPYAVYSAGHVVIYVDFPSVKIFDGFIDREILEFDFNNQDVTITAIGKEKYISDLAAQYDITQAFYYKTTTDNYRQRNGRTAAIRYNPDSYTLLSDLLGSIIGDLGYSSFINIPNNASFKTKYNAEKYGSVSDGLRPIAVSRNRTSERGILPDISSNVFTPFPLLDSENGSYNLLLKEFAKLTNNIYFYSHKTNKIFFIPRDYNGLSDEIGQGIVNIDDFIIDSPIQRNYNPAYNGIFISFDDIDLAVYSDTSLLIPGDTIRYGINMKSPDTPIILLDSDMNYYLGGFSSSEKRYKLGNDLGKLNKSLYLTNALRITMSAPLSDYLRPGFGGDSIQNFMINIIWNNFYSTLRRIKKQTLELSIPLFAPLRILYQGLPINVFDTETDMWTENTIIKFDY